MSTPDERRDLERIERALADGQATATDPRERELEELALALRAEAPEADPEFARTLDRRVAEGFARERRLRLPSLRLPVPALAGAAALLVAAVIAAGVLGGEEKSETTGPVAQEAPAPAPTSTTERESAAPAAGQSDRVVERAAQITIAAAAGKIQAAAEGIGRAAESHGGYVVRSNVAVGDEATRGGSFTLRVPTKELEAALTDIGRLGEVRSRNESSQDMTVPFRGVEQRLTNALLERRATREKLDDAVGDEAEDLKARLRAINAEVADLNGQMEKLRRRTVFSTVNVTLEEREDGGAGAGGNGPGAALDDALGMLVGAVSLAIRALGVLVPVALIGALAWLSGAALRRRRREAALF